MLVKLSCTPLYFYFFCVQTFIYRCIDWGFAIEGERIGQEPFSSILNGSMDCFLHRKISVVEDLLVTRNPQSLADPRGQATFVESYRWQGEELLYSMKSIPNICNLRGIKALRARFLPHLLGKSTAVVRVFFFFSELLFIMCYLAQVLHY